MNELSAHGNKPLQLRKKIVKIWIRQKRRSKEGFNQPMESQRNRDMKLVILKQRNGIACAKVLFHQ